MLEAKTVRYNKEIDDEIKSFLPKLIAVDNIFDMDEADIAMIKTMHNIKLLTDEYLIEQARTLDEINNKLDKLLGNKN